MQKLYEVLLTRDTTESATVQVEADSKEAAAMLAIARANLDLLGRVNWERNDNAPAEPYLGDCEENDVTEIQRWQGIDASDVSAYCATQQTGWDLFDSGERGTEIEREDAPDYGDGKAVFEDDNDALAHVWRQAESGEPHAMAALAIHYNSRADYWAEKCREAKIRIPDIERF